ncbi:unnamed protein product [Callosobruchus maculatus]|uniref:Uncharacterized protein n=1 Tax=Callosobruchus maculatus TaxID=64391 RepID=A0A653BTT4_CALMS|nr:unnamed protein product [Callosobruchus maculatus]
MRMCVRITCLKHSTFLMRHYTLPPLGKCGKKSFPTKKHMKTQSSRALSNSYLNGRLSMNSSFSRYSFRTFNRTKMKSVSADTEISAGLSCSDLLPPIQSFIS